MSRKILTALISLLLFIVSGCATQQTVAPLDKAQQAQLIEQTLTEPAKSPAEIFIIHAEPVAYIQGAPRELVLLTNVYTRSFKLEQGVFSIASGSAIPVEIHFKKAGELWQKTKIIYARDGTEFVPSLQAMARGNQSWYEQLLSSQQNQRHLHNLFMERLAAACKVRGFVDYSHPFEAIPGLVGKHVLLLPDAGNRYGPGNKLIVVKADYKRARAQIGKVNWPHYPLIIYNKATGIALRGIGDFFDKTKVS